jgi:hypothetical protein
MGVAGMTLDFKPIPEGVAAILGAQIWQARHGSFVFTIVTHPTLNGEYDMTIACVADYLPHGPFSSLEEAVTACNSAANTLEG